MSRSRLYERNGRFYADLRDFRDVIEEGCAQEALIPEGESYATKDRETATRLMLARLDELRERRRNGGQKDVDPPLREYAREFLRRREEMGTVRTSTLKGYERHLRRLVEFLEAEGGEGVRLSQVTVEHLRRYWRVRLKGGELGPAVKKSTLRTELVSLGTMFKTAMKGGKASHNPVRELEKLPTPEPTEQEYLEVGEAARLIEAAREMVEDDRSRAGPYFHPLVATFLLTGGRRREVFGLLRRDVDFAHEEVHFRRNEHRRLKRPSHQRVLPLWPQLKEILAPTCWKRRSRRGCCSPVPARDECSTTSQTPSPPPWSERRSRKTSACTTSATPTPPLGCRRWRTGAPSVPTR